MLAVQLKEVKTYVGGCRAMTVEFAQGVDSPIVHFQFKNGFYIQTEPLLTVWISF